MPKAFDVCAFAAAGFAGAALANRFGVGMGSAAGTWTCSTTQAGPTADATPHFLLYTNAGLEESVVEELNKLAARFNLVVTAVPSPWGARGYVSVILANHLDEVMVLERLMQLRSVHDVFTYHRHLTLDTEDPLASLHADLLTGPVVPTMPAASSFRVTCWRAGQHKFTSIDVEKCCGDALHTRHKTKGSMKEFEVEVRVDIVESLALICTQRNKAPLSKRHKQAYCNIVTLKPNIAYVMLQLAGVRPGCSILDPFCGSGTLILECAELLSNDFRGCGCDCVTKAVTGSQQNAEAGGFSSCTEFVKGDARSLYKLYEKETFDMVVTNVPWGVQTGKNADLVVLYTRFLKSAWEVTKPGAKLVMIVLRAYLTLEVVRTLGKWKLVQQTVIRTSNNLPTIIVLERLSVDPWRENLQSQLYALGRLVNLSKPLWMALHDKAESLEVGGEQVDQWDGQARKQARKNKVAGD